MGMTTSIQLHSHASAGRSYGLDDGETPLLRCKPEGIDELSRVTKFSRKELQIMYRGFKQECPSGIVDEDTFRHIYAQFFPQGDSGQYAHNVFRMFDVQHNGCIRFVDFVMSLSVIARGSLDDKLRWTFDLYDTDGDGVISRSEMTTVVASIYALMGRHTTPAISNSTVHQHVDRIFQIMDKNQDGVISVDEFMEACTADATIMEGIMALDTNLCS